MVYVGKSISDNRAGGGGVVAPVLIDPFSANLEFTNYTGYGNVYSQVGEIAFIKNSGTFGQGAVITHTISSDGVNDITLDGNSLSSLVINGDAEKVGNFAVIRNDYTGQSGYFRFVFMQQVDGYIDTFVVKIDLNLVIPLITGFVGTGLNTYVDVTLNNGIYGANDGTTPAALADFAITNLSASGVTAISISSITNTSDTALVGGETTVRCNLSLTGTADGTETFQIQPTDGASLYSVTGVAMASTETTGTITLNIASSYDTFYQAVYDQFLTKPDTATANAQNTMIAGMRTDGVLSKLTSLFIPSVQGGNLTTDGNLNWTRPTGTGAALVLDQAITALEGWGTTPSVVTPPTTGYTNLNFDPASDLGASGEGDMSFGFYSLSDRDISISKNDFGSEDTATAGRIVCAANTRHLDQQARFRVWNSSSTAVRATNYDSTTVGMWIFGHDGTNFYATRNETDLTITNPQVTGTPGTGIFNCGAASGGQFSLIGCSAAFTAVSLTLTERQNLSARINTYMTFLGINQYT